ncbi:hypothetical protein [Halarcobacter sp.]|uniref:hypothetical protein n=1 Tax=Halarcobacter sp. TaxID=2321133 RepID=UPI002AA7A382|nr:hypothetical protein [Halarcobacter sp.]
MKEINIEINGLSIIESNRALKLINHLIKELSFLDLRRFTNILISSDYKNDISFLLNNNSKKNRFEMSKDIYAAVLTLETKNDYEFYLVVKSKMIKNYLKNEEELDAKKLFHILHHEFAHIHDNNKKIDAFKNILKNKRYEGVDSITYPIAELCWSEYIANYISSSSAIKTDYPISFANSLLYKVNKLKDIKTQLTAYKINNSREDLIQLSIKQVESVLKSASYLIGYLNGLNINLNQLDCLLALELEKTDFIETFINLTHELNSIHHLYPNGFITLNIYNNLAYLIKEYYKILGIHLFEEDNVLKINLY